MISQALAAANDLALALAPSAERKLETAQQGRSFMSAILGRMECAGDRRRERASRPTKSPIPSQSPSPAPRTTFRSRRTGACSSSIATGWRRSRLPRCRRRRQGISAATTAPWAYSCTTTSRSAPRSRSLASAAEQLKDFKPKEALAAAEVFDPSPDNIDRRTKHLEIDGIRVSLLQKKTRGETVVVNLGLQSGDEKSMFGQRATGQMVAQMLMRGTSRYSREQLRDEFVKLKVNGAIAGKGGSFETTRPNVVAAIRLAAHVLREPSFPPAEFEQLKKVAITSIESQLSDPAALASTALAQQFNTYPKGDVRYSPSLQEQLDEINAIKPSDLPRYHKTFYGAEKGMLAIVGDFDEAEVVKAIRESFAGWRSEAPFKRITGTYTDIAPIARAIETPDKANAVFLARMNLDLNEDDADYPALFSPTTCSVVAPAWTRA